MTKHFTLESVSRKDGYNVILSKEIKCDEVYIDLETAVVYLNTLSNEKETLKYELSTLEANALKRIDDLQKENEDLKKELKRTIKG